MFNFLKKHLIENNFTYFEHFKFATKNALFLLYAGLVLIIHAFFPFVFTETASIVVKKINKNFEEKKCQTKEESES